MMKMAKELELGIYANYMVEHFGNLSDSHIIMAEYNASIRDPLELEHYVRAANCGVPIFADGLVSLYDYTKRVGLPSDNIVERVFINRARGFLWSAWTPSKLSPGKILERIDEEE
jgi:hypothetical protein